MIRATYGATAITRVTVGSTRACTLSHGRDPGGKDEARDLVDREARPDTRGEDVDPLRRPLRADDLRSALERRLAAILDGSADPGALARALHDFADATDQAVRAWAGELTMRQALDITYVLTGILRLLDRGKAHGDLGALAFPRAVRTYAAAVHLDQALDQRRCASLVALAPLPVRAVERR